MRFWKNLASGQRKHEQAIFGTLAGIPKEYYNGAYTISKDGNILYLFVNGKPNGPILLKRLKNEILNLWVVGNGTKLNHEVKMKPWWSKKPGVVLIDLPEDATDEYISVIAVRLSGGEVELFKE